MKATKAMWEMMESPKYVRVLAGPVGSGKSVCTSHELVKLAMMQEPNQAGERKTRSLIVRNTVDQLKSTTMKTFFDWFPQGQWGVYKATEKTFYMNHKLADGTTVKAEFMFIALDTPDDVRKALSLEATFLWGNEWRELHPDVVDGLLMRLRRYPSGKDGGPTRSGAILDTNMPDMDTWHFDKMENPPDNWSVHIQPSAVLNEEEYYHKFGHEPDESKSALDAQGVAWYVNPEADNIDNLDPLYYPDIVPGKSVDFIDVYLRCKYGRSLAGTPVYEKSFIPEFHIAKEPLKAIPMTDYPLIVGVDFGRTPCAVFKQRDARGRVLTLAELSSFNMGIEKFVNTMLNPFVAQNFVGYPIVCAPDPAGFMKQQQSEMTLVDVLTAAGYECVKPPTNKPEYRIQAVERLLNQQVDGQAMYLVDPSCEVLLKGFKHGYRYKKRKNGMLDASPDKNEYSHLHDANQYADSILDMQFRGAVKTRSRKEVRQVKYLYT
jgi:hypothetical protein